MQHENRLCFEQFLPPGGKRSPSAFVIRLESHRHVNPQFNTAGHRTALLIIIQICNLILWSDSFWFHTNHTWRLFPSTDTDFFLSWPSEISTYGMTVIITCTKTHFETIIKTFSNDSPPHSLIEKLSKGILGDTEYKRVKLNKVSYINKLNDNTLPQK